MGWIGACDAIATWKAPFLKGKSVELLLRVPSGYKHRRAWKWISNQNTITFQNKYTFSYGGTVLNVHLDGKVGHFSSASASWKPTLEKSL